jgi:protein-L-isoaspartate(D-aspartate) O-methyltransferase
MSHVSEDRVARLLVEIPRHRFFPAGIDASTPDNQAVPLGRGRILPPVDVVAMMIRALELEGTERILDVGGGTGYQAALLSHLAREVVSVEADDELVKRAASALAELGRGNVRVVQAEACTGWPEAAPYQGIMVVGAAAELPRALVEQLDLGGRLVIPLGDSEAQLIERLRKHTDSLESKTIGACRLDSLPCSQGSPWWFPWTRSRKSG